MHFISRNELNQFNQHAARPFETGCIIPTAGRAQNPGLMGRARFSPGPETEDEKVHNFPIKMRFQQVLLVYRSSDIAGEFQSHRGVFPFQ